MNKLFFAPIICLSSLPVLAEENLGDVVVTSSRAELEERAVTVPITVIDRKQLDDSGLVSAVDILRTQVGIAASNDGGAGKNSSIRIRGEEGYRTLFVLDGIELTDPTGTQMSTRVEYLTLGEELQRIEILRGPQGFVYGADAGGVVNMISREAQKTEGALNMENGKYDSANYQGYLAGKFDNVNGFLSINHSDTEGFNARVDDLTREADGYRNTTLHAKLNAEINEDWTLGLVAHNSDSHSLFDQCYDADFATTNDCVSDFGQSAGRLFARYDAQDNEYHQVAFSRSDVTVERLSDGQLSSDADGKIEKIEYVGNLNIDQNWQIGLGLDSKYEGMETTYSEYSSRRQRGLFSELRYQFDQAIYLGAGIRVDHYNIFDRHFSHRLSAAYVQDLNNDTYIKYRAAWGTGYRAPSLYEQKYNVSSTSEEPLPALKEEFTEGGDIALEVHTANGSEFSIGYFEQAIEDEIQFDLINYTGYLQGDGVSHSKGVEVSTVFPMGESLSVHGNFTFNDTLTAADQLRVRRPKEVFNLGLTGQFFQQKLVTFFNFRYSADVLDIDGETLPDYSILDGTVSYAFSSKGEVYVRCQNLMDEEYVEVGGFNTAARNCAAGLQVQM